MTPPTWLRVILIWALTASALLVAAALVPGFDVTDWRAAVAVAMVLGLLEALVWPLVVWLALPLTVITIGIGPLLLNAGFVVLAAGLVPGVTITGLVAGLAVAVVVTAVTVAVTGFLAIDDDALFDRRMTRWTRRQARRRLGATGTTDVPGVLFLQVDGLGHEALKRAVRNGDVPTIARWLSRGSHRLHGWVTDWSSQTGASQAGILLGSNEDMPAFRWYEKEAGRQFVSNNPGSAAELERRHSNGRGLLHADGASRSNIFTGDAKDAVLTMSVATRRKGRIGAGYYAYFASPYNTSRTLLLLLTDIATELRQSAHQRRRDVRPRVHRGGVYPLLRAFTTVVSRDVTVATLIRDLYDARSVIYADFLGYDEVAHHSGVERSDATAVLRRLDREFARLERAAAGAPRPYRIVMLSDHGQSQGATFRRRYDETLGEVVHRGMGRGRVVDRTWQEQAGEESWGYAGGAVAELAAGEGIVARTLRRRAREGELGPERDVQAAPAGDAIVFGSGNLGLVYLTRDAERMTLERISALYPDLVPTLVDHPGVGFVLVRSAELGSVVLGRDGARLLATGEVRGLDPLAPFGPHAARQVARADGYAHCADLMVNSMWDPQTDEVAAFEELVGSHGGLGGEQTRPFVLAPADLAYPAEPVLGAEALHQLFRPWLADLGHSGYADVAGATATRS